MSENETISGTAMGPSDSDAILAILEAAGVDKADQFDALVAVQKLTQRTAK